MSHEEQILMLMNNRGLDREQAESMLTDISILCKAIAEEALKENEQQYE